MGMTAYGTNQAPVGAPKPLGLKSCSSKREISLFFSFLIASVDPDPDTQARLNPWI